MPVTTAATPEEEIKEFPLVTVNYNNNNYSTVRVLEGDDTLTDLIKSEFNRYYGDSNLYLWNSEYSGTFIVIAGTEQSALDWLADFGILDSLKIPEDEEKQQIEEHGSVQGVRLGNAGEPFDIRYSRLQEISLSDIQHIDCQLKFGGEGFLHIWRGRSYGEMDPIRDVVVHITADNIENFEFSDAETWGRDSGIENEASWLQAQVKSEIFNLIEEYR